MFPMFEGTSFPFQARYPGKKAVTIFSQGNENKDAFQATIQFVNGAFSMFGWELINSLLCCNTNSPNFKLSDELLEQAFSAGKLLSTR